MLLILFLLSANCLIQTGATESTGADNEAVNAFESVGVESQASTSSVFDDDGVSKLPGTCNSGADSNGSGGVAETPSSTSPIPNDGDNVNGTTNYPDLAELCKNVPPQCDNSTEYLDTCPTYCPSDCCPTGPGQNQRCQQPHPCPPPACKCRFNHRRLPNGKCIPTRECPAFACDKENEEYNPCPPICPTDSCSQATPSGRCPLGRIGIILDCNPTCRCKKGYWRKNGVCVPYNECKKKCSGPNEVYACGGACDNVCADLPERSQEKCPIINIKCNDKCYCINGYARNDRGICIPIDKCPKKELPYKKCSGPNEFYACGGACDNVCADLPEISQKKCPIINIKCNDKCYCINGYARNDRGICIPIDKCPEKEVPYSKCLRPHEVYTDCKKKCPSDLCRSIIERCIPDDTCTPGCVCKSGYMRNNTGEPCFPFNQCPQLQNSPDFPIQCLLPYEEYTDCKKKCPSDLCSSINVRCIPDDTCTPGCVCKSGYMRNNTGEPCFPFNQCPQLQNSPDIAIQCLLPYEEYTDCKKKCPSDLCSSINVRCIPDDTCTPGCVCKSGYLRNSTSETGPCILSNHCPQLQNSPDIAIQQQI